jgi:cytochrome c553
MQPTAARRLLAPALLLACAAAHAQQPQAQQVYTAALAANCANCHGTGGRAADGSAVPGLAGMPRDYLVAQMQAFRSGARPATVMHQLAKGFSDAQLEQIAAWFAAQPK